jgi:hypothetical protein
MPDAGSRPSPGPPGVTLPSRRQDPDGSSITQWHRGFALLAVVSLFIGTRTLWTEALTTRPALALVITACYGAILTAAVLIPTVSSPRVMTVVEAVILVVAVVLVGCMFVLHHKINDEGALVTRAADAILHGAPVYGVHWPDVFKDANVTPTKTMDGGVVDFYPYPPLAAILTAVVQIVVPSYVSAAIASTAAFVAGSIVLWLLLPAPWRSAGTAITLGFGLLFVYAHRGYPAVVAFALLVPVAVGWTSIGSGGQLGRRDVFRALCLGAACAAQQLVWFLVPFLLAGIWSLRRGELPERQVARFFVGFIGITAATFVVINLPFVVGDPGAWLQGVLSPLTQSAVPHGQGLVGISYYMLDGSARLSFFSYAALLYGAAILAISVLFMRRLGPAMFVLPWTIFYLATRSQDGYYVMMTPLWLASLASVAPGTFAGAWQPRSGWLGRMRVRRALVVPLLMPAMACLAIAIGSEPPLQMHVFATTMDEGQTGISEIEVRVTNTDASPLRPHFAVSSGQAMSAYWRNVAGPDVLAPGQTADYRLVTASGLARPGSGGFFLLRAVTSDPVTLSSTTIPAAPSIRPAAPSTASPSTSP